MSRFWKTLGSAGKKILKGGKQKTTGTEVVNPFELKPSKKNVTKKSWKDHVDTSHPSYNKDYMKGL
jgi:hypothetical protein